jgi:hypothetical protein
MVEGRGVDDAPPLFIAAGGCTIAAARPLFVVWMGRGATAMTFCRPARDHQTAPASLVLSTIAFVYGVFMIINLSWPRYPASAWYDNWQVLFSLAIVLVVGAMVYFIQRARGVELSATIHEIDESPAEAQAMEAMAAGEAGKTLSQG